MNHWSDKYVNIPYKLFGTNPETGMDCFTMLCYIFKEELDITIPFTSSDVIKIADDAWFQKTSRQAILEQAANGDWEEVDELTTYDLLLMSIGSTNVVNHVAMYIGNNNIIQMLENRNSAVYKYHKYYQQYTLKKIRWKNLKN